MDERKDAYMHNCIPHMEMEKENSQIMDGREKSSTLYQKDRNSIVSLDAFEIKKIIG